MIRQFHVEDKIEALEWHPRTPSRSPSPASRTDTGLYVYRDVMSDMLSQQASEQDVRETEGSDPLSISLDTRNDGPNARQQKDIAGMAARPSSSDAALMRLSTFLGVLQEDMAAATRDVKAVQAAWEREEEHATQEQQHLTKQKQLLLLQDRERRVLADEITRKEKQVAELERRQEEDMSARAEEQRLLTEELHAKDLLLARHDADRQRQVEELGTTTGLVLSLEQQVLNSAQTYITTLRTQSCNIHSLRREGERAADITDRRASRRLRARTETLQPSTTKSAGRTPAGYLNQHLQNLGVPKGVLTQARAGRKTTRQSQTCADS